MVDLKNLLNIKEKRILDLNALFNINLQSKIKQKKISFGTNYIDDVLGGGLSSGNIYLVYGASQTGKTQFCHQICVQSIMNDNVVYYLDTENTFRAERVTELAMSRNLNPETILKSLFISKVMSSSMLLLSLNDIEEQLNFKNAHVLIIDTINNYFRFDQGDTSISFNKTKTIFLNTLKKLKEITIKYNLITIATAQISSNFIDNTIIRDIPVGNQYLNHYISEYLYLRLEDEKVNSAHLVNSQFHPEKKRYYKITKKGLEDFNK